MTVKDAKACLTIAIQFRFSHTDSLHLHDFLQVRKELEVCGIECYPQKEFDEDIEDKSDNDKIRVRDLFILSQSYTLSLVIL